MPCDRLLYVQAKLEADVFEQFKNLEQLRTALTTYLQQEVPGSSWEVYNGSYAVEWTNKQTGMRVQITKNGSVQVNGERGRTSQLSLTQVSNGVQNMAPKLVKALLKLRAVEAIKALGTVEQDTIVAGGYRMLVVDI